MRIAYLDCFSGISGDMFLGAAIDAGVSLEKLQTVARALDIDTELVARRVERNGIGATKVDVLVHGRADQPLDAAPAHEHEHEHTHEHEHEHEHTHEHEHEHTHEHEHEHTHEHEHEHTHEHVHGHTHTETHGHEHSHPHESHHEHAHRGLPEIREIIARAPIASAARDLAFRTFELLAKAEAKIHNRDIETIHFHEVGSEDAIVDIVCSAVAADTIGADRWYCSALNVGGGTVKCAHGVLPVPAPATAELLRSAPVFSSGIQKELLTPTGAAILRALNVCFEPLPAMTLSSTGYGAGGREFPGVANVVRLSLGESGAVPTKGRAPESTAPSVALATASGDGSDSVTVLESNLDDMNPQLFSYVQQKLLAAGALDAFGVPVQMKKGRPGIIMTVLAPPELAETLSRILLTETTTLGVRMRQEQRRILEREHVTVQSPWGPIRVKLGRLHGEVVNCAPEFEDCRAIAEATGTPLKTVLQEAMRLYLALPETCNNAAHNASKSS